MTCLENYLGVDLISDIQNPTESPWLSWLINGDKEYEGRLQFKKNKDTNELIKSKFGALEIGNKIAFYDKEDKLLNKCYYIFEVLDIKNYTDFASAFSDLGKKLVPCGTTPRQVQAMYEKFWSRDEIKNNAMVLRLKFITFNRVFI